MRATCAVKMGAAVFGQIVDSRDAGVIEGRQDARLAFEAGEAFGVFGKRLGQNLDRYLATELGVLGPIHRSHAALAELGGDPEVRECPPDQERILPAVVRRLPKVGALPRSRKALLARRLVPLIQGLRFFGLTNLVVGWTMGRISDARRTL